jgi:hypothetical protein
MLESTRSHATGKTNVKVWDPKPYDQPADGPALVQIHLEEDFSGDIQGSGVADSLWAQLAEDAASMVGMARVTGSIAGRSGAFLLQAQGTLRGATVSSTWFVVPGSGTGQLSGLRGEGGFTGQRAQRGSDVTLDYWFE